MHPRCVLTRLTAFVLALALGLPSPAYALRVPEARDAGMEKVLTEALAPAGGLEEEGLEELVETAGLEEDRQPAMAGSSGPSPLPSAVGWKEVRVRVEALQDKGWYAAALGVLDDYVRQDRAHVYDPEVLTARAGLLVGWGRSPEAVSDIREVLARDPQHVRAHLCYAKALGSFFEYQDALREIDRALRDEPESAVAHRLRIRIQLDWAQDRVKPALPWVMEQALRDAQHLVTLDPSDFRNHVVHGQALFVDGQLDQAAAAVHRALALLADAKPEKRANAHVVLARIFRRQQRTTEMVAEARAAARCDPKDPRLILSVVALVNTTNRPLADLIAKPLLDDPPADDGLRKAYARLLDALGRRADAEAVIRDYLTRYAEDHGAQRLLARWTAGGLEEVGDLGQQLERARLACTPPQGDTVAVRQAVADVAEILQAFTPQELAFVNGWIVGQQDPWVLVQYHLDVSSSQPPWASVIQDGAASDVLDDLARLARRLRELAAIIPKVPVLSDPQVLVLDWPKLVAAPDAPDGAPVLRTVVTRPSPRAMLVLQEAFDVLRRHHPRLYRQAVAHLHVISLSPILRDRRQVSVGPFGWLTLGWHEEGPSPDPYVVAQLLMQGIHQHWFDIQWTPDRLVRGSGFRQRRLFEELERLSAEIVRAEFVTDYHLASLASSPVPAPGKILQRLREVLAVVDAHLRQVAATARQAVMEESGEALMTDLRRRHDALSARINSYTSGLEEDGRRAAVPDVLALLNQVLPVVVAVDTVPATLRGTSAGDHYLVTELPLAVHVESLLRSRAKEVLVQALVIGHARWPLIGVGSDQKVDDYRRALLRRARHWDMAIPCSIHSHNEGALLPSRVDYRTHGLDGRAKGHREFIYGARTNRLVEYGVNPRRRRGLPSTIRTRIWRDGTMGSDTSHVPETVRTPLTALSDRALHVPLQDPRVRRLEMDDWKGRWVRWDRAVTVASVLQEAGIAQPAGGLEENHETERRGPGWYFQAAQRAMGERRWRDAEAAWTTVLDLNRNPDDPGNAKIHMGRAKARMAQGDVLGTEEDCTEVIRLNGDGDSRSAPAFHLRADARTAQQKRQGAARDWSAFIALLERRGRRSLNSNDLRDLETAYRQRGRLRLGWGDYATAEGDMWAAIEISPQDAGAYITLAEIASEFGWHEHAKHYATCALANAPDSVSALLMLAKGELGLGELAAAESHVLRAIELKPKASAYTVLADVREHQGRTEEALAARREASNRAKRQSSASAGGLEEPESEARERAIQREIALMQVVDRAQRLREVAARGAAVTLTAAQIPQGQRPLRLIFADPATYSAIPVAAKAGIPTLVVVPAASYWNIVRSLWYGVRPTTSELTILIEPATVRDRYTRGYRVYEVGPATEGWLNRLAQQLQAIGVALPPPEVLTPALEATRDYFQFA